MLVFFGGVLGVEVTLELADFGTAIGKLGHLIEQSGHLLQGSFRLLDQRPNFLLAYLGCCRFMRFDVGVALLRAPLIQLVFLFLC